MYVLIAVHGVDYATLLLHINYKVFLTVIVYESFNTVHIPYKKLSLESSQAKTGGLASGECGASCVQLCVKCIPHIH
jgi:hypothetical protein